MSLPDRHFVRIPHGAEWGVPTGDDDHREDEPHFIIPFWGLYDKNLFRSSDTLRIQRIHLPMSLFGWYEIDFVPIRLN